MRSASLESGTPVDWLQADRCLRTFQRRQRWPSWLEPLPKRPSTPPFWYRDPGLWLPLSCAIATDAVADGNFQTSASPLTWNHNYAGDLLVVGVYRVENSISSVTYNSLPLTPITTSTNPVTSHEVSLWYLIGQAAGLQQIAITPSAGSFVAGVSGSYSGTNQTAQPDNFDTEHAGGSTSSYRVSLTPNVNNCWILLLGANDELFNSEFNCVVRQLNASGGFALFDTDGPISPAASTTLGWDVTFVTTKAVSIIASIAPAGAAKRFFLSPG